MRKSTTSGRGIIGHMVKIMINLTRECQMVFESR